MNSNFDSICPTFRNASRLPRRSGFLLLPFRDAITTTTKQTSPSPSTEASLRPQISLQILEDNMKVTYTSYTAVAEWKWDLPEEADDTCGICRVQFEGTCAKCKYPGEDCPIGALLFICIAHNELTCFSHRSMYPLLPHALH